jgi:RNA ligase
MKYNKLEEVKKLVSDKLVSARPHPSLPLTIYNYSAKAQFLPVAEWSDALQDCRGLILDADGNIVARPFRKFWNYEQVLDKVPADEPFTVWEKLDGSLGVVAWYGDSLVVATRGSFESDQARWAQNWIKYAGDIQPGLTYLFEIIFPSNRIVVDYNGREDMPLLAVLDKEGRDHPAFDQWPASKALRYDGLADLDTLSALELPGEEGFVVRWESGFRAKIKFAEYKRLHRLITQCSTRTIWELLRTKQDTADMIERVPKEFELWVRGQIADLEQEQDFLVGWAHSTMKKAPVECDRKTFALWAVQQEHPKLLFALLDGNPIDDMCWKMCEPRWCTPFRKEAEE